MDGMEALGEAIERGEVKLDEEDNPEDWEEEKKVLNGEGEEVSVKKWEPVKVSKELDAKVMKSKKTVSMKEDEALLEDEEEEIPELVESEGEEEGEMEEEEEEGEGDEEEGEEEGDEEDGEEEGEMEEEHVISSDAVENKDEEKNEDSPEERERIRQRRIEMARKVLATRVLTPKDYRILQGDNDNDSSSEEDVEVANAMVSLWTFIKSQHHSAVVNPDDLLGYQKKRKDTIEVRTDGRSDEQERRRKAIEGRREFQMKLKGGGTTNKEKERKKNFMMVKQSYRVKNKLKQSIQEQQQAAKKQVRRLQILGRKANKRRRI